MHSSVHQTELLLFFTLRQLVIIILVARLAGRIAERTGTGACRRSPGERRQVRRLLRCSAQIRARRAPIPGHRHHDELVVLNVGLDLGVTPPDVFTMLMIMAIASTAVTTPALRIWLRPEQLEAVVAAN